MRAQGVYRKPPYGHSRKKSDPPEADKYRRYASVLVMAAYHK